MYSMGHSHTIPRIANGGCRTGLTSLYQEPANGGPAAGGLPLHGRYIPPPPLQQQQGRQFRNRESSSPERARSVEHFLQRGDGTDETEETDLVDNRSRITQQEVSH